MRSALDKLKSLLGQHRGSKGVMSLLGLCSSSLPMQQLGVGAQMGHPSGSTLESPHIAHHTALILHPFWVAGGSRNKHYKS